MNNFLLRRSQVDEATKYLKDNNLVNSGLSCKDYEAYMFVKFMEEKKINEECNIADLGSSGSVVLENVVALGIKGLKYGIDLAYQEDKVFDNGIHLFTGDLIHTNFSDNTFDVVTCISVIEHAVSVYEFAKEVHRIAKVGADIIVSFDYHEKKLNTKGVVLYNLDWNIFSKEEVVELIEIFKGLGMELSGDVDWTTEDMVINSAFCSPAIGIEYTFGILHFIKK